MSKVKNVLSKGRRLKNRFVGRIRYRPDIRCLQERHGTDYGGWVICPAGLDESSIVYSFGVGEDISFDLSIIDKYGVQVYAFDPIPRSIAWVLSQKVPSNFRVFGYGVSDHDGIQVFNPPKNHKHISYTVLERPETARRAIELDVRRISTIMGELGHSKVDIIKMNIEGAEYAVIKDLLSCKLDVKQLLVGFHPHFLRYGNDMTRDVVGDLRLAGYKVFNISYTGRDFSFLRI